MTYLRWRRFLELAAIDRPWVGELFMRRVDGPGAKPAEHWDKEYERGEYDRLLAPGQRDHLRLLAAMVADRFPNPRVLDMGCGEGVFYDVLKSHRPARYLGVDISEVAIRRAQDRVGEQPGVQFVTGDGARFETDETFDAVVFPECIEYLGDIDALFAHYARNLNPGGVFGVTQWLGLKPLRLWRQVKEGADIVEEAVVSAPWGGAWQVWLCRPKG